VAGPDGGLEPEPPPEGIVRPAPQPEAENSRHNTTKLVMRIRRVRRNANRPSGDAASHRNVDRAANERTDGAVEATPVSTVTETVVALPSETVEGVTLQVELAGIPVQVNATVPGTFAAELSSSGENGVLAIRYRNACDPVGS
jgi:hypothetical protein